MNARAEFFSDSDSLYTKRRTIFMDVNSGTASAEHELFPLEDFGGPFFRYPDESDAPTTLPQRGSSFSPPLIASALSRIIFALDINPGADFFWGVTPSARLQSARELIIGLRDLDVIRRCWVVFSPSSTLPFAVTRPSEPPILDLDWSSCFAGFVDEEIEDGMTASLGEKISNLIRFHGSEAIKRLKELISSNELSPALASHTLRWLGRIEDSASFDSRLELLCESLRSESPEIRDSASLGLAVIRSSKAIECLQEAIKQETLPGLRADMEQVLRKLQN